MTTHAHAAVAGWRQVKVTKFKDALEGIDDMYYEMEWDIHSWVPLVSRLFPSDTLKVWKRGKYIRLDTTLLNVSEHNLKRGARSYVISVNEQTDQIEMMTVDHESRTFATEVLFELPSLEERAEITAQSSKEADVYMASELQDVDVTTSKVTFTPAQAGWIGFRHDREEEISGRTCRVYNINGLDIVSETRTEHLNDADIKWNKQHRKDLQAGRVPEDFEFPVRQSLPPPDRPKLTFDEYAAMAGGALKGGPMPPHLGRTMRIKSSVKHVKGMVWMCDADAWPLSTNVMLKLLTVLAPAGEHLKKVEAFLRTTMPPGFPLKLDVPVFPTVSARVTSSGCRPGEVDAALYEIPEGYEEISVEEMEDMHIDDEDEEEGDEQRAIEGGDEGEGEAGSSAIEGPAGDGDDDDEWEDAEDGDEGSTA